MKLYLSSYYVGDLANDLVRLVTKNKKAALINNALDYSNDEERRKVSNQKVANELTTLGFETEEVDLKDYFGKTEELKNKLQEFGLIWARGGNSFVLRRAMAYSGFDEIIRDLLDQDIVYGGFSAGACVAAPTLKGIDLVDDPKIIPEGYDEEIIWEGMGLVDYSIVPHYKSEHEESALIDDTVEYFKKHSMPYKTLKDGEVIVIE